MATERKVKNQIVHIPSKYDLDALMQVPDPETVTDINKVSRSGPRYVSLKDNDKYNGMRMTVMQAEIIPGTIPDKETGAINDYIRAVAAIYPPEREATKEDVVILQTGSGDIARRIIDALDAGAFPATGILHKHGRAWSWD